MNVSIFHGTGSNPDHFWFPWLKRNLQQQGIPVWLPQLPNPDHPSIESWVPFVLENGSFDSSSVLVGHSAGCPLILSILERLPSRVDKIILVSGFAQPLPPAKEDPIIQGKYDWERIRSRFNSLVAINSDNDPWGCDDKAGKFIVDHLGGTLIVRKGDGHMGSLTYHQPYEEFPLVLDLILKAQ